MTDTLMTMLAKLQDFVDSVTDGEWASETSRDEALALIAQMQRDAVQPVATELIAVLVSELRRHRYCGDTYPENGWPEVNAALAAYEKWKRAAPHPEAQALDSQLQQPAADSTRASGVCASTTPLPCPFCGDEPVAGEFDVQCYNAFCEVQPWAAGQSLAEAVAGWNRRSAAGAQQQDDHAGSPAPSEPVAVVGSDFQLLWCRKDWSKGLRVGDKLYTRPAESSKAALPDEEIDRLINESREADEGPSLLVRRIERAILSRAGITRRDDPPARPQPKCVRKGGCACVFNGELTTGCAWLRNEPIGRGDEQ